MKNSSTIRYESKYGQTIYIPAETFFTMSDQALEDLCVNMTRYNEYSTVRIGKVAKSEKINKED
jgi:hypothetical protein